MADALNQAPQGGGMSIAQRMKMNRDAMLGGTPPTHQQHSQSIDPTPGQMSPKPNTRIQMINKMNQRPPEVGQGIAQKIGTPTQQLRESRNKERQQHMVNISKQIMSPEQFPETKPHDTGYSDMTSFTN